MAEKPKTDPAARSMREAAPYLSAVWKLMGGAAAGVAGGYFLDKKFGTSPWLLLVLATLGCVGGFIGFITDLNRLGKKK